MELILTRIYFPDGTNGILRHDGKLVCKTIELPWLDNKRRVSCIPEGKYFLEKRYSRRHKWHIEIADVPKRQFILFHSANNAKLELNGCVAPVTKHSGAGLGLMSRKACKALTSYVFQALEKNEEVVLIIQS